MSKQLPLQEDGNQNLPVHFIQIICTTSVLNMLDTGQLLEGDFTTGKYWSYLILFMHFMPKFYGDVGMKDAIFFCGIYVPQHHFFLHQGHVFSAEQNQHLPRSGSVLMASQAKWIAFITCGQLAVSRLLYLILLVQDQCRKAGDLHKDWFTQWVGWSHLKDPAAVATILDMSLSFTIATTRHYRIWGASVPTQGGINLAQHFVGTAIVMLDKHFRIICLWISSTPKHTWITGMCHRKEPEEASTTSCQSRIWI